VHPCETFSFPVQGMYIYRLGIFKVICEFDMNSTRN